MSILFLDFDGVLHPDPPNTKWHLWCKAAELAAWLQAHEDVEVVVSSTWRLKSGINEIKNGLHSGLASRIVGATGVELSEPYARQVECEQWLRAHRPPWTKWAALDDRNWNFRPFEKRLVLCQRTTGLTQYDFERLVPLLSES
jgi:hypothetical protein